MVHMKNVKRNGNTVTFDGYINGIDSNHFTMSVDLNDSSKSTASIEDCFHTGEALSKILYTLATSGKLPTELVANTH